MQCPRKVSKFYKKFSASVAKNSKRIQDFSYAFFFRQNALSTSAIYTEPDISLYIIWDTTIVNVI